jgi:hypothetical protein
MLQKSHSHLMKPQGSMEYHVENITPDIWKQKLTKMMLYVRDNLQWISVIC